MQKIMQKWIGALLACWLLMAGAGVQAQTIINSDDSFTGADTALGVVTGPSVFNAPSTGAAYTDQAFVATGTGVWQIVGHTLVNNEASATGQFGQRLYRPIAEKQLNQGIQVRFTEGNTANLLNLHLREQSTGATNGLFIEIDPTGAYFCWHNGTGQSTIGLICTYATLVQGTNYIATFSVSTTIAGTTVGTFSIARQSDGVTIGSGTLSETTSAADTHTAGTYAVSIKRVNTSAVPTILTITTFYTSATNLSASATSLATSSSGNGLVLTGTGTNWLTSNPTFTATGVTGCSITEQHILSNTSAIIYVSTGATTGTLTLTDPSQMSLNTTTLSVAAAAGTTPIINLPIAVGTTNATQCKISCFPAYGGVGPYTYHAYRAHTSISTTAAATQVADPVFDAATGLYTLTYTPPTSGVYCYRITATDSYTTPKTGQSASTPDFAGYNPPTVARTLPANNITFKVAVMGDSIEGYQPASGVPLYNQTVAYLAAPGNLHAVTGANQAYGGATTVDFDPAVPGAHYAPALAAAQGISASVATIMLGTNDAAHVSKATYKTGLSDLCVAFAAQNIKVMLHYPDWQTGGDGAGNDSIVDYCDAIDELVAAGTAIRGDRNAVPYFAAGRNTLYTDNLHPNAAGVIAYATFHADALLAYENQFIPKGFRRASGRRGGSRSATLIAPSLSDYLASLGTHKDLPLCYAN